VEYTSCYVNGRIASTSDPMLAAEGERAQFDHDRLGRVVRIAGVERPLQLTWDTDGVLARVVQGGASPMTMTQVAFAGVVRDRVLTTQSGTSRLREGGDGLFQFEVTGGGAVTALAETRYALPGGAQVSIPAGGTATLQIPGLDGSTLATVAVPTLGAGAPATGVGPGAVYGPYGEPLVAPDVPDSAAPMYGWRTAPAAPTLPGADAITLLGARAYLPATGLFLSPDPIVDAGNNMYSYTSGDPVNFHDSPGEEETPGYLLPLGYFAGAVGVFLSALYARGVFGVLFGVASYAASVASFVLWTSSSDDPATIAMMGLVGAVLPGVGLTLGQGARSFGYGAGRAKFFRELSQNRFYVKARRSSSNPRAAAPEEAAGSLGARSSGVPSQFGRMSNRASVDTGSEMADRTSQLVSRASLPRLSQSQRSAASLERASQVRYAEGGRAATAWNPKAPAMEYDFATGLFLPMSR
jgi:RHS repeat-associated protein